MTKNLPTDTQIKIANTLGIDISSDSRDVAAARIREVVEPAINPYSMRNRTATQKQIKFATSLGLNVSGDSFWVCSAKIDDKLRELNQLALERLKLKPGDKVIVTKKIKIDEQQHEYKEEHIVSSIGKNLRVYFKGGGGRGAWPSQIEKVNSQ
jgi:hypothetical protein